MLNARRLWPPPPEILVLERDEVHLWHADLDRHRSNIQAFCQILTEDEQHRASRLRFQRDRDRFIVARGLLKTLLGGYLSIKPVMIRFCYGRHGKPNLDLSSGKETLRFNLSHSDGLVFYALTRDREIGVDLERVRAGFPYESITERFFSPQERAALYELPIGLRRTAFFTLWTLKEAYLKARGVGLSSPLDRFDISPALKNPTTLTLLEIQGDPNDTACWLLRNLAPAPDYRAAVAVENHGLKLKELRWRVYGL